MQITDKLQEYVKRSITSYSSSILITDLQTIKLLEISPRDKQNIMTGTNLNTDILDLVNSWKHTHLDKSSLFCILNGKCLRLFENDDNQYSSQMIFPLCKSNEQYEIIGLIIFFRTNLNYIPSSIKSVSGFIKFVNQFILEGE